ncbi:MAG: hypothetical protein KAH38_10280, partial [Candidatus Hydrogenedentes bacterium]|nr:hypothetical protein [Candidatus Hydrogenedentota bacterium]
ASPATTMRAILSMKAFYPINMQKSTTNRQLPFIVPAEVQGGKRPESTGNNKDEPFPILAMTVGINRLPAQPIVESF